MLICHYGRPDQGQSLPATGVMTASSRALFRQVVQEADLLDRAVDHEAFCKSLRELFDIVISFQTKDDIFIE